MASAAFAIGASTDDYAKSPTLKKRRLIRRRKIRPIKIKTPKGNVLTVKVKVVNQNNLKRRSLRKGKQNSNEKHQKLTLHGL